MKKILAVIAVLAITLISSVALAEVTVSGSIDTRGRAFNNLDHNKDVADYDRDTQSRVRINFDGKAGDATAKVTLERDWETWGKTATGDVEVVNGPLSDIREAWVDVGLFGPVRLKGGHMLAALGNGWFVRSMKFGSDAWLAYAGLGSVTAAFVNVKIYDTPPDMDGDLYSVLAVAKLSDTMTVGGNLTRIVWAKQATVIGVPIGADVTNNFEAHADLGLGPVKLKAEVDFQMGTDHTTCGTLLNGDLGKCAEYKGNQLVVEAAMAAGPATINVSVGQGSGNGTRAVPGSITTRQLELDHKAIAVVQDADPRTTFLYEYKFGQPGINGAGAHQAYQNLTAVSAGADAKLGSLMVGGSLWILQTTEDVTIFNGLTGLGGMPLVRQESDLGMEIDARVNWKISDAVSLNTTLGYFMPGDAYQQVDTLASAVVGYTVTKDGDESTGIQTVLSVKF